MALIWNPKLWLSGVLGVLFKNGAQAPQVLKIYHVNIRVGIHGQKNIGKKYNYHP